MEGQIRYSVVLCGIILSSKMPLVTWYTIHLASQNPRSENPAAYIYHLRGNPTLPSPNRRPRRRITLRTININHQPRIRILVRARKRNQRGRRPASPTGNSHLRTAEVQLRAVERARAMQGNMLDSQQVVARGHVLRDSDGEGGLVERRPGEPVR